MTKDYTTVYECLAKDFVNIRKRYTDLIRQMTEKMNLKLKWLDKRVK
jgi:hypothetical protein